MSEAPGDAAVLDWAWAGAPLAGERESGDAHVVAAFAGGALVAVLDGLGHGPEAALASRAAARVLVAHAGEPVAALVERCHEALRPTRGAVMSVACFQEAEGAMTWVAVGNVEGILLRAAPAAARAREAIVARGGVVGYQLPPLRPVTLPVTAGDTLVLATDGIRSGFVAGLEVRGEPQQVADAIFAGYARGSDDALVLVARYLGGSS
ncbi:SpoIIE family protein phosphatase [Anaeromyxobacter diazotrophicus]|uniref:Stage II sporulation protein E n=1 Tax=Anaeromyxobacter diazotrophicus TaxID=2590199 RepID=A0A7I9VRA9_9BACT|nr:SpoIIE family protein phosphatase [Anaeromyxobacter diazotrophicus]GEJ58966.1 stage II sporulation protein E [Anaeromyxobacter diazotrophicus]